MMELFLNGCCDETIAQMFRRRTSKHQFREELHGKPAFHSPELAEGDYILGVNEKDEELYSWSQYLNAHCLTTAGSGAGKTMLARFKILQVAGQVRGMFLFDLHKREFGILKPYLKKMGIDLKILTGRSLKINPLQLPMGVTVSDWVPRVADMLIGVLGLPPRASKLLQAALFRLYRQFESRPGEYPTLFDLYEAIKADKGANHQARIAILDSLEPVLLSLGPDVLAWRKGWDSNDLAKRHIVFELGGVSETDKDLLLNSLVLSVFISRIARGISNPRMDLWICMDEAQRLCGSSDHSAISNLIGLIRGTGIGLDLSLQSSHGVSPHIISNTATKIMGRCGSMADYAAAGGSMGLNAEQIHWAQMNLRPGLFIGQLSEGNWRQPFVFKIPPMNFPSVTGQSSPESDLDLPVIPADEFRHWGQAPEIHTAPAASPRDSLFENEREYRFCKAVIENPMQPSGTYPKLAGIGAASAKTIREGLIARGFIREHLLETGKRGRGSILLEPLEAGKRAVAEYGGES